ncbi:MAG: SsrA-binding protein SmpB [Alphaproteobacteria bacterium]
MAEAKGEGLVVARNRKARFDYAIEDTFEAGIALTGSEVKSLRGGRASIADSHAAERGGEIWLLNAHIPEYAGASHFGHETRRPRKLLLHRRQISRLLGALQREGKTLVPLAIYFNRRGRAKVELALAHGKKTHDKRAAIRDREWARDKQRLMRARG